MDTVNRTITEERAITKTVYIADDGTEFDCPDDCVAYEEALERKRAWDIVKNIEKKEDFNAPFDTGESFEERWYNWYKPKNAEELRALNTFYGTGELCDIFSEDTVGEWVCVETDCSEKNVLEMGAGFAYAYKLSDSIDYAERFFAEFGLTMTLTEA